VGDHQVRRLSTGSGTPTSATGDLEGLTGEARIEAGHDAPGRLTLVYELG
jgi:hypothetical protein